MRGDRKKREKDLRAAEEVRRRKCSGLGVRSDGTLFARRALVHYVKSRVRYPTGVAEAQLS
jgi:hypothetical protein